MLMCGVYGAVLFVDFCLPDTATTEIYTLSLHDALPIWRARARPEHAGRVHALERLQLRGLDPDLGARRRRPALHLDRKSTRLNSSHLVISYAVFCLKKKTIYTTTQ